MLADLALDFTLCSINFNDWRIHQTWICCVIQLHYICAAHLSCMLVMMMMILSFHNLAWWQFLFLPKLHQEWMAIGLNVLKSALHSVKINASWCLNLHGCLKHKRRFVHHCFFLLFCIKTEKIKRTQYCLFFKEMDNR